MLKTCVSLLTLWLCVAEAHNKCCNGTENRLIGKICADGDNITGVTCEIKYLINPDEENASFTEYKDGTLLVSHSDSESYVINSGRYCMVTPENNGKELVVACFEESKQARSHLEWLLRGIGGLITVIFLIMTIIVYILVPNMRDLQGKCTLGAISNLAIAFFFMSIAQIVPSISAPYCEILAFLQYFFYMSTFFWLNLVSFHIWKTTMRPGMVGTRTQWLRVYYSYGFGAPIIFLLAALIADFVPGKHLKPNFGKYKCGLSDGKAKWAYFYGPIAVLLIINTILFMWILKLLWKDVTNHANFSTIKVKSARYRCLLYLKLFFIMGLTWILELLSALCEGINQYFDYFWNFVDFVNVIQGVLIFIVLVMLRKRALRGLSKRNILGITFPRKWISLNDEEGDEDTAESQLPTNGTTTTEELALNVENDLKVN